MIRVMGSDLPLSPPAPAILGMDFAGTVEAVGEGVSAYSAGDEVYGCAGGLADLQGTLAEYIVATRRPALRGPYLVFKSVLTNNWSLLCLRQLVAKESKRAFPR